MAVEAPADLAAMFSTDDWAVSAVHTPSGAGASTTVAVILDRPRETIQVGEFDRVSEGRTLLVSVAELAAVGRGDTFVVSGETLVVAADAERDVSGLVWEAHCR